MSIGKAVMFVDARILDDNGEEVPSGEIGELAIKAKMSRQDIGINQQRLLKAFHGRYLLTGDLAKWTTMAIYLLLTVKRINHNWWRKCLTIRSRKCFS